jgi:hypothetical protein
MDLLVHRQFQMKKIVFSLKEVELTLSKVVCTFKEQGIAEIDQIFDVDKDEVC